MHQIKHHDPPLKTMKKQCSLQQIILLESQLTHDSRIDVWSSIIQHILQNNLVRANISYKDQLLLSTVNEYLSKFYSNYERKTVDHPINRYMPAAPRTFNLSQWDIINLHYKNRQSQFIKSIKLHRCFKKSQTDSHSTERNTQYTKSERESKNGPLGISGHLSSKNQSRLQKSPNIVSDYFINTQSKFLKKHKAKGTPKGKGERVPRKSNRKLQTLQSQNPYYLFQMSPKNIPRSKSFTKIPKKQSTKSPKKLHTQSSTESVRMEPVFKKKITPFVTKQSHHKKTKAQSCRPK